MSTKTVLHMIETSDPDGAEKMMVHLAMGLSQEYGSEAALIRDGWLASALRSRGVPVKILGYADGSVATFRDLLTLRDLLRHIRERRIAILHAHEFFMSALGLAASWMTGVPLVATVHGRGYYVDRLRRRLAFRLIGRFSGQLVAVSEGLRQYLTERTGIPSRQIRVVPNGVPLEDKPSAEERSALRKSLGIDEHCAIVGAVGRLYPEKGHAYLIEAIPQVVRRVSRVVFLLAGRGDLQAELEGRSRQLGVHNSVRFLGHREDVRHLLSICAVFALPSLSEGMPLSLIEAMSACVPAVATHVGGVGEVVEHERTGLLVPPADSRALATSIIRLLEDRALAARLAVAGRNVVLARFSVDHMVRAYESIYAQLAR